MVEEHKAVDELPWETGDQLLSPVISLGKSAGGDFKEILTLTMDFDLEAIGGSQRAPGLYRLDLSRAEWIALENQVVDRERGTVSGTVDGLGIFAVIIKNEPPIQQPELQPVTAFSDLERHWARAWILQLTEAGAMDGYPDGTFRPDQVMTRAEITVVLVRALSLETRDGEPFADVAGHWAEVAIGTARAHGIILGYTSATFGPDDPMTREQLAMVVLRATGLTAGEGHLTFRDQDSVSRWAVGAIETLVHAGVIQGYPDGRFLPHNHVTRAETAVILSRWLSQQLSETLR